MGKTFLRQNPIHTKRRIEVIKKSSFSSIHFVFCNPNNYYHCRRCNVLLFNVSTYCLGKRAKLHFNDTYDTQCVNLVFILPFHIFFRSNGFALAAPVAFTVLAIFNSLQFTSGTLPYAMKCIAEAKIAFSRYKNLVIFMARLTNHKKNDYDIGSFIRLSISIYRLQSFLELPEYQHPENQDSAQPIGSINIIDASMAWEVFNPPTTKGGKVIKGSLYQIH